MLRPRNGAENGQGTRGDGAIIHGQIGNFRKVLGVSNRGVFRIDHRSGVSADFDGLRRGGQFERHIKAQRLTRIQLGGSDLEFRKARNADHKFIVAELEVHKMERSVGICSCYVLGAVVCIGKHHLGAEDNS